MSKHKYHECLNKYCCETFLDSIMNSVTNAQKIKNKWMSKFEKNDVFFWKNKKNHNMIIKIESAFSISISSEIKQLDL